MDGKETLRIRALTPDDAAAWRELWRGYQIFYRTVIPDSVTQITWGRLLDPAEPVHGAVALSPEDGSPIGFVHWILHRSTWTAGPYCYLEDLFVAPARRGTGAGRALIEHVYAAARAAGCSQTYWLTHETNKDAMQLYDRIAERSGFVQYAKPLD